MSKIVSGEYSKEDSITALFDNGQPTVLLGDDRLEKPKPEWVRGECPQCGDALVSNGYYVGGRGYLVIWECWSSLGEKPTCNYRRVL